MLSDIGPSLFDHINQSDDKEALLNLAAQAMSKLHRAGGWHGTGQLRDMIYDDGQIGYIDFEESIAADVEAFMHFLEIINTAELLRQSLSEGSRSLKYVSFDSQGNFQGTGHLKPLFRQDRESARPYTKF